MTPAALLQTVAQALASDAALLLLVLLNGQITMPDSLLVGALTAFTSLRHTGTTLGFYNASLVARQTITGSRSSGAALVSLLSALGTIGLFVNETPA